MSNLRCRICEHRITVSDADPDTSLSEMVRHVAETHGRDPILDESQLVVLEEATP